MSTTVLHPAISRERRAPRSTRLAQAIFLIPLGLLQLIASVAFTAAGGVHGAGYAVAAWAVTMAATGIAVALRLGRADAGAHRAARVLLAGQTAFAVVKLAVYHESASLVFLGFVVVAALALRHAARRRGA